MHRRKFIERYHKKGSCIRSALLFARRVRAVNQKKRRGKLISPRVDVRGGISNFRIRLPTTESNKAEGIIDSGAIDAKNQKHALPAKGVRLSVEWPFRSCGRDLADFFKSTSRPFLVNLPDE